MKTLAIFSPNRDAYSETFIQSHRKLPFNIKFYYGGYLPSSLDGESNILQLSFIERITRKLLRKFSFEEKRLMFSLRKEKVDFVLAEYGPTAADSLNVVKYLNLPLIVHFHGFDASVKELVTQYRHKYTHVFKYATKVIVVSSSMYKALVEIGCPEEKLKIIYYGPDESFFDVTPDFTSQQFTAVGRFVEKKAPYLTIFSFRKVVDKFPGARLLMVGDGQLLSICKSLSRLLSLEKNIDFHGVCTSQQIKDFFRTSIAFVQHSKVAENGDSEGTPVAVLEAQASGLPVISTYHAGIPDVVLNDETGLLVEEHDIQGMANNMIRVLEESGLAKKLGFAGKKRVTDNFTMKLYLSLIENQINLTLKK